MPERLECEVLQKARYINTLTYLPTLAFWLVKLIVLFSPMISGSFKPAAAWLVGKARG